MTNKLQSLEKGSQGLGFANDLVTIKQSLLPVYRGEFGPPIKCISESWDFFFINYSYCFSNLVFKKKFYENLLIEKGPKYLRWAFLDLMVVWKVSCGHCMGTIAEVIKNFIQYESWRYKIICQLFFCFFTYKKLKYLLFVPFFLLFSFLFPEYNCFVLNPSHFI